MPIDELDIHQIIKRLELVERVDLDERLNYIERQMKHFAFAASQIDESFKSGIKISIDERSLNFSRQIAAEMNGCLTFLRAEISEVRRLRQELTETTKSDSVTGAMTFMAKQLKELTHAVHEIKANGIKKNIHLDLTMDGYEMVKRKSPKINLDIEEEDKKTPEETVRDLLATLMPREGIILTHRFGLLGESKKTLAATGKVLGISAERVRGIESKALRKCRHPSRRFACEDLTHLELRKAIIGE